MVWRETGIRQHGMRQNLSLEDKEHQRNCWWILSSETAGIHSFWKHRYKNIA